MKIQSAFKSAKARDRVMAFYDECLAHWPVPYQTRMLSTSFGQTYVIISGSPEAKPLVLLHGSAINSTMWFPIVAALSSKFQIFCVDLIGQPGRSAGTRPLYQSDGYAHWLKEVFGALKLRQSALCGLSLGAMIAYKFTLLYPETITSLALLAPPLSNSRLTFVPRAILANISPIPFFVKYFFNYISASASKLPKSVIKDFIVQYQSYKYNWDPIPFLSDKELSRLPRKTLIILGENEVLCDPVASAVRIRSVAPFIRLELIPNAKHTVTSDQPKLVSEILLKFL